jgi:hypothetical protein
VHQNGVITRQYPHHPKLGRHQRLDGRSLAYLHRHDPTAVLKPVEWAPKVPVLDQEDLHAQGIRAGDVVKGGGNPDALGSCTGNGGTAALSVLLPLAKLTTAGLDTSGPVPAEKFAIALYSDATKADDDPGEQWPPTDCGSSGLGIATVLKRRGLIDNYVHATNADDFASLLQLGGVLMGMPWLQAFFTPDADGFIDSDANWASSGVAGGHEVCVVALVSVVQDADGHVVPEKTVIKVRNSWTDGWGDGGYFYMRLSTYNALRSEIDLIQLRLAA